MSKLLEKIKKDQLDARRERDSFTTAALTTLLGEASPSGREEVIDEQVEKVVQKFVKNLRESIGYVKDPNKQKDYEREIKIFEKYLPQQLSENELKGIIHGLIDSNECKSIGDVMKSLNKDYKGRFDGKMASSLAKAQLTF